MKPYSDDELDALASGGWEETHVERLVITALCQRRELREARRVARVLAVGIDAKEPDCEDPACESDICQAVRTALAYPEYPEPNPQEE